MKKIDLRFTHQENLENIPSKLMVKDAVAVCAETSKNFKSTKGHQSQWAYLFLHRAGLTCFEGLKEGLLFVDASDSNLTYTTGLPASCAELCVDGTPVQSFEDAQENSMTEGLKNLSARCCLNLKTLKGMPSSVKKAAIDETKISSFEGLSQNAEEVSATWCPYLKTTRGLSPKCKKLNLDWSNVKELEDIPTDIQEIRVYGCHFERSTFDRLNPVVLPKLVGLEEPSKTYVAKIYANYLATQNRTKKILEITQQHTYA